MGPPVKPYLRPPHCSVDLRSTTAVGDRRYSSRDEILMESADCAWTRAQVRGEIDAILRAWGPSELEV